jgi:hypothetical protein
VICSKTDEQWGRPRTVSQASGDLSGEIVTGRAEAELSGGALKSAACSAPRNAYGTMAGRLTLTATALVGEQ